MITKEYQGKKKADSAKENFAKKHVTRTAKESREAFLEVAETDCDTYLDYINLNKTLMQCNTQNQKSKESKT